VAVFGIVCGLAVPTVADEAKGAGVPGQLENGLISLTKVAPPL
jgi:hypothetical protein